MRREQQEEQNQPPHAPTQLVTKKKQFVKTNQLQPGTGTIIVGQTVWHRDITAAKAILYKGNLYRNVVVFTEYYLVCADTVNDHLILFHLDCFQ